MNAAKQAYDRFNRATAADPLQMMDTFVPVEVGDVELPLAFSASIPAISP
ncbi:hypothetical protein [Mesorhizobium sp. M1405]